MTRIKRIIGALLTLLPFVKGNNSQALPVANSDNITIRQRTNIIREKIKNKVNSNVEISNVIGDLISYSKHFSANAFNQQSGPFNQNVPDGPRKNWKNSIGEGYFDQIDGKFHQTTGNPPAHHRREITRRPATVDKPPFDRAPFNNFDKDPFHNFDKDPFHNFDKDPFHNFDKDPFHNFDKDPFHNFDKDPFHNFDKN